MTELRTLRVICLTTIVIALASMGQFIIDARRYMLEFADQFVIPFIPPHGIFRLIVVIIFFSLILFLIRAIVMFQRLK